MSCILALSSQISLAAFGEGLCQNLWGAALQWDCSTLLQPFACTLLPVEEDNQKRDLQHLHFETNYRKLYVYCCRFCIGCLRTRRVAGGERADYTKEVIKIEKASERNGWSIAK